MHWLELVAWLAVVILAIPLTVLTIECLAAFRRWSPAPLPDPTARPRSVVLIPAHNEERGIARTLLAVTAQLGPADRILVVADNCNDDTASIARSHGADVVERSDPTRRGKGYALAFGRDSLQANPPDAVIILDADCILGDHCLHRLAAEAVARQRPVQAAYIMSAPADAGPDRRVAAFAFLVKNFVRPLGLRRLGLPCLLTGTGMAFPWTLIQNAPLGHGHIVEDMGLAVDLAIGGHAVTFIPEAEVRGEFPVHDRAAGSQRQRWEHGHMRVMSNGVPRLLAASLLRGRVILAALAFEIAVPPLSALVLTATVVLFVLLARAVAGGPWQPATTLGGLGAMATFALALTWCRYGRNILPVTALVRIPLYATKKIGLYLGFFIKPQQEWIRTSRDSTPDKV